MAGPGLAILRDPFSSAALFPTRWLMMAHFTDEQTETQKCANSQATNGSLLFKPKV